MTRIVLAATLILAVSTGLAEARKALVANGPALTGVVGPVLVLD